MRRAFWLVLAATLAAKLWLAAVVPPLGDEAFYWLESGALAPGYSDVPLATPWLIRLGTALAGVGTIGIRWPFVLLGALVPWLVVVLARRCGAGSDDAWSAGLLVACLPLGALFGALAVPDVPLTVAILLATLALERAARAPSRGAWIALGLAIALGWLSHYRVAILYVAGALFALGTRSGRNMLKQPGFWAAQGVGLLGLVPALVFNAGTGVAALRFQFVERHPWSFHAETLREPLVQALVTTPLLFGFAVVALVVAWRRRDAQPAQAVVAATGLGVLGGFLLLGLFADVERSRFHWPLPAYLVALPLVPALLRAAWQRSAAGRALAVATPVLGALAGLALAALMLRGAGEGARRLDWITENLSGWDAVGAFARDVYAVHGDGASVAADNFMLGAQVELALGGKERVFVLDHPLNAKHGRATQLFVLGRDERALGKFASDTLLVFVDEASRRPADRLAGYQALCARWPVVRMLDERVVGRSRHVAFRVRTTGATECDVPAFGYVDTPAPDAVVGAETAGVTGWAFKEHTGLARVELLVDGVPNGSVTYGTPAEKVRGQWPSSTDPNHPRVGFAGMLSTEGLAPGGHTLALRLVDPSGRALVVAAQRFEFRPGG